MTSSGDHPSWVRAVRFVHGVQFLGDFVTAINTADPRHAGVLMTLEDGHTAPHLRIEVPPTPRHLEPQVRCVPWPMIAEYTPAKVSDDAELLSRMGQPDADADAVTTEGTERAEPAPKPRKKRRPPEEPV